LSCTKLGVNGAWGVRPNTSSSPRRPVRALVVVSPGNGFSKNDAHARLAFSKDEAASTLGCSVDFLEEHVLPELAVVRRGRRVFVAVAELERWLDRSAALTLGER
jgi:hypothetical protein